MNSKRELRQHDILVPDLTVGDIQNMEAILREWESISPYLIIDVEITNLASTFTKIIRAWYSKEREGSYDKLGTTSFRAHTSKTVCPACGYKFIDFEKETEAVEDEMKRLGLK